MIQVIGFTGKMGCGKSTAVEHLLSKHSQGIGPGKTVAERFAAGIYKAARAWYAALGMDFDKETARKLLQFGGTEWGRGQFGPDFWIDRWAGDVKDHMARQRVVLVEDVRFDNEAEAIRAMGGRVIEVVSNGKAVAKRKVARNGVKGHASEAGIAKHLVDVQVQNSGSLAQFLEAVDAVYDDIQTEE